MAGGAAGHDHQDDPGLEPSGRPSGRQPARAPRRAGRREMISMLAEVSIPASCADDGMNRVAKGDVGEGDGIAGWKPPALAAPPPRHQRNRRRSTAGQADALAEEDRGEEGDHHRRRRRSTGLGELEMAQRHEVEDRRSEQAEARTICSSGRQLRQAPGTRQGARSRAAARKATRLRKKAISSGGRGCGRNHFAESRCRWKPIRARHIRPMPAGDGSAPPLRGRPRGVRCRSIRH